MLVWWLEEGLRGFITFRIRKIKYYIYKGLFKNGFNPPQASAGRNI
jgi:hypothetical protein